ncbi:MAG: hypothetical protein JOY66_04345 [Acetobacteraceae bacterium]|nr:hypothetical protein [Acetobacteraceae bacterium]
MRRQTLAERGCGREKPSGRGQARGRRRGDPRRRPGRGRGEGAQGRAGAILSKLSAENDGQRICCEIVRRAVLVPPRQVAADAGEDGAVAGGKVLDAGEHAPGFDARATVLAILEAA